MARNKSTPSALAPAPPAPVPAAACAVEHTRCVGLDEDGFDVIYARDAQTIHFCARHALAAEALTMFAGFPGPEVVRLLKRLEEQR